MTPQFWVRKLLHWLHGWAFEAVLMGTILVLVLFAVALVWDPDAVAATLAALVYFSPLWLPAFLFVGFWTTWIHYVRYNFWFGLKHVVLQIDLPPDVQKSPLAMELFLTNLWNSGGESTFIARLWKGAFRPIWSLEIASNEGQIHYYLHLREIWREAVEARLYGQFPEAKVSVLAEDYVGKVPFNLQDYELFGGEFAKSKPDPVPIKTYIDWGLHMDTDKPEKQVDPLTHVLELMGALGPGEYMWMQFIIKARKADEWYGFYREGWFKKDTYADQARKAIEDALKDAGKRTLARALDAGKDIAGQVAARGIALLSQPEKDRVEAIERNLGKLIFECGIRVLYLGEKGKFKGINNGALINIFRPWQKPEYNAFRPTGPGRGTMYFDYPWQDWNNWRLNREKRNQFFRYKHRAYFYVPYDQVPVMMTTEELASIWHFPSAAIKTPTLSRVPSRRADAPSNLPTGPAPADLPL